MSELVPPHGGVELKPLIFPEVERSEEKKRAETLKKVSMTSRETSDVIMMAMGAYSPLSGFMGAADWHGCVENMRLSGGVFWPIPVTLSADHETADGISVEEEVALVDGDSGRIMAIMEVQEKYAIDKASEARHVYHTTDTRHPGVQKVVAQGDINLGGRVIAISEGEYPDKYPDLFIRPADFPCALRRKWLVEGSSVSDPQPHAPQPRAPRQDCGRGY